MNYTTVRAADPSLITQLRRGAKVAACDRHGITGQTGSDGNGTKYGVVPDSSTKTRNALEAKHDVVCLSLIHI